MTKQNQIYKCEICGNVVEVLHEGAGELVYSQNIDIGIDFVYTLYI